MPGCHDLVSFLQSPDQWSSLQLSRDDDTHLDRKDVTALISCLIENNTLTALDLGGHNIGSTCGTLLAATLARNGTLTTLGVSGIHSVGTQSLSQFMSCNAHLTTLNLSQGNIGRSGAIAIAALLSRNKTLTALDLRWNRLTSSGVIAIAASLHTNTTLEIIDLRWCGDIGTLGVTAFSHMLKRNTGLTGLNFGCRSLNFNSAMVIAESITLNTTLKAFMLQVNGDIQLDGINAVVRRLALNTTLEQLDLCPSGHAIKNLQSKTVPVVGAALSLNETLSHLFLPHDTVEMSEIPQLLNMVSLNRVLKECECGFVTGIIVNEIEQNKLLCIQSDTVARSFDQVAALMMRCLVRHVPVELAVPVVVQSCVDETHEFSEDVFFQLVRMEAESSSDRQSHIPQPAQMDVDAKSPRDGYTRTRIIGRIKKLLYLDVLIKKISDKKRRIQSRVRKIQHSS